MMNNTPNNIFAQLWRRLADIRAVSNSKGEFFLLTLAAALLEGCGGGGGGQVSPQPKTLRLSDGDGGDGDDTIVIVGVNAQGSPTHRRYEMRDLVNVRGEDVDVSEVVTLDEVNANPNSETIGVTRIDGGAGFDTLVVYGVSDLSGIDIAGIERILINSEITLSVDLLDDGIEAVIGGDGAVLRLRGNGEVRLDGWNFDAIAQVDVGADVVLVAEDRRALEDAGIQLLLGGGRVEVEADDDTAFTGIELAPGLTVSIDSQDGGTEETIRVGAQPAAFGGQAIDPPATLSLTSAVPTGLAEDSDTTTPIKVADIAVTGVAAGRRPGLEIGGADAALFELNAEQTALFLRARVPLDYENEDDRQLEVTVYSATDTSLSASLTVTVTDVNEAPEIARQSLIVAEGETMVGTVDAADPEGDSVTYRISGGNDDGIFVIDENTGEITVAVGEALDIETVETHRLTVTVSDPSGSGTNNEAQVIITVTDVNEAAPVISGDLAFYVGIGRSVTLTADDLSAIDGDAGDNAGQITWQVTVAPAHGYLALASAPAAAVESFTQAQIDDGEVIYVNDGGGTEDFFVARAADDGTPPQQSGSVAVDIEIVPDAREAVAPPYMGDNKWISAILWHEAWTTGSPDSSVIVIEYAFQGDAVSPSWREYERAAFRAATEAWEAVTNIDFVEVGVEEEPEVEYWLFPGSELGAILGFHSLPHVDSPEPLIGGFNHDGIGWGEAGVTVGGFGFETLLHEIGHGLGLLHPHDGDGVGGTTFPGVPVGESNSYGDYGLNQGIYTVMSYNSGWEQRYPEHTRDFNDFGWDATPMAFDVAAIQALYGVNEETAAGDDIYLLPSVNEPGTYWLCIWDTGGDDTISAEGVTLSCEIDLRAADLEGEGGGGYVSYAPDIIGGFTIAHGVVIERAIGGSDDDIMTGNDADNILTGGDGADIFVFHNNFGSDTITDFDVNRDIIRFVDFTEVVTFADFRAACRQDGGDVVYDFGDDGINVLRLEGVTLGNLAASNTEIAFVTASLAASAGAVTEGGQVVEVSVTLSSTPGRQVVIPVTVTESGGIIAGDYGVSGLSSSSVTLAFAADASGDDLTQTFTVTAVDDSVVDTDTNIDEHLQIAFGALPGSVGTVDGANELTVRFLDNDISGEVDISADGVWNAAEIDSAGDVDGFRFSVLDGATYRVTAAFIGDGGTGNGLDMYVRGGGEWSQHVIWSSMTFTAIAAGTQIITVSDYDVDSGGAGDNGDDTGDYRIRVERVFEENVDAAENIRTVEEMTVGSVYAGTLSDGADEDWVRVRLSAGEMYVVTVDGSGDVGLTDPLLLWRDADGDILDGNDDLFGGVFKNSRLVIIAPETGDYYLEVDSWEPLSEPDTGITGTYNLAVSAALQVTDEGADVTANTGTTAVMEVDGAFLGGLTYQSDTDWVQIELIAGIRYLFELAWSGDNDDAAAFPLLRLRDEAGELLETGDLSSFSGIGIDSRIYGGVEESGVYYLDVSARDGITTGEYLLTVNAVGVDDSNGRLFSARIEQSGDAFAHQDDDHDAGNFDAYIAALGGEEALLFG